jgi:dipeptidyl aminopeptidase/acylaminoacyl peptidase
MFGSTAYPGAPPQIVGDTIVFCARDRGCTHGFSVPLAGGAPRRIIGSADTVTSGLHAVTRRITFVGASPRGPGEIFVAATDGDTPRRLTQHVGEALGSVDLQVPEERIFTAADGTEIHGWLLQSKRGDETGPTPLLLDVHGGPHNAWSPVFDGVHLYHQLLAAGGWSILLVNPRGSDGYGEKFFGGVTGAWGVADMGDFTCALDVLIEEGIAEPGRIAVTGYSYGGYMTNWLTAYTDYFSAAVSGGCLSNMASDFGTADSAIWHTMVELGGTPFEQPERFRELSPITAVTQVDTPTLLLHGEADTRCPIEQAEQWFTSLRARRVPVELVRYPGASHLFIMDGRPSHRRDYNERLVDWVVRHTQST